MNNQQSFDLNDTQSNERVEEYRFQEPIRGYPELRWAGKRPFRSTRYYPAQLKESYNEPVDGWMNRIYWGDNLQVMSHLLKEFRGKVQLVYIDPPFDSKADYKKKIKLKGQILNNDRSSFEEKQYSDIWTNDEYLQFIYERLIVTRELMSDTSSIYLHCDWHKSHNLRSIMDEVFGNGGKLEKMLATRILSLGNELMLTVMQSRVHNYMVDNMIRYCSILSQKNTRGTNSIQNIQQSI